MTPRVKQGAVVATATAVIVGTLTIWTMTSQPIKNGGFERGLWGWQTQGNVRIVSGNCHSGNFCIQLGP